MVNIAGEFLEEVKPAFRKQIKHLLKEASSKLQEAKQLIVESKNLSNLIEYNGTLGEDIQRLVVNKNQKLLEEIFGSNDPVDLGTEVPEDEEDVKGPGEEPINLVTGNTLIKKPGRKTGPIGPYKKAKQRRYKGIKTKVEYRGVTYVEGNSPNNRYRARFAYQGIHYEIGFFETALEAAHAYDETKYLKTGKLTGLNFPERIESRLKKKQAEA